MSVVEEINWQLWTYNLRWTDITAAYLLLHSPQHLHMTRPNWAVIHL